jgi:hypothetical protein
MVAGCIEPWDFSDTEKVFLQGSISLIKVILPMAICFLLWRRYVMNKAVAHRSLSILDLNDDSGTDCKIDSFFPAVPTLSLLLYVTVSIVTFNLGLLAVSTYDFLYGILRELLN